jgi:hypothetical protein
MTDSVLARVAALKTTPTPELKSMWRDLFDTPGKSGTVRAPGNSGPQGRAD